VALGWSRYANADYSGAAAASAKAHELAVLVCDPFVATSARVLQSCLLADVGAATVARELVADLPAAPDPQPAILRWMVAMSRGRAAVQLGDLDDAQRQLRAQQESMWPEGGKVFAALLAHRYGASDEGLAQLEEMLHTDDPALGPIRTAASAILARIAVEDGIRDEAALGSVFDAVSRAAPQQLWQPLIVGAIPEGTIHRGVAGALTRLGHGPAVAGARGAMARYRDALEAPALVVAAALPSASPAWADELSAGRVAGTGLAGPVRAGTAGEASSFPSSPMTERENDVLRELALGGSYTDIALSLFITQNTVKTHLSAIYRKLGVAGRSAALREARRRTLI
jgi:DNA-binding CsgD family transcriptional regulator